MAKCGNERELLRQTILNEAQALGQKPPRNIDDAIDVKIAQLRTRQKEVGFEKALSEVTDAVDIDALLKRMANDGDVAQRRIATAHKTKRENPDLEAYTIVKGMVGDIAYPVSYADGFVNLETVKKLISARFYARSYKLLDKMKNVDEVNQNDSIRGFFGEEGAGEAFSVGKQLRELYDDLNIEVENAGELTRGLQPRFSETRMDQFIKKNGEKRLRSLLVKHAHNGSEFFDKWYQNGRQQLSTNILNIKNADSWIALNDELGSNNFLFSIYNDIERQATTIGIARDWGSRPIDTLNELIASFGDEIDEVRARRLRRTMRALTRGSHYSIANNGFVRFLRGGRNLTAAALLGKAWTYAFMDTINQASWHAAIGHGFRQAPRALNPISGRATREFARIYGNGLEARLADHMSGVGMIRNRFTGDEHDMEGGFIYKGIEIITHNTFKYNGVRALYESQRAGAMVDLAGILGGYLQDGIGFNDLPIRLKAGFGKYGIREEQWNHLMQIRDDVVDERGLIDWHQIEDEQLSLNVGGYIIGNADVAVISPGVYDDMILQYLGLERGEPMYEVFKTVMQFMDFAFAHMRKIYGGLKYMNDEVDAPMATHIMTISAFMAVSLVWGYNIDQLRNILGASGEAIATGSMDPIIDAIENPFAGGQESFDALTGAAYVGAFGGVVGDHLLLYGGIRNGLAQLMGAKDFPHDPTQFPIGAFFGTSAEAFYNTMTHLISGDLGGAAEEVLLYGREMTPMSSFPVLDYIAKDIVDEQIKEMFR